MLLQQRRSSQPWPSGFALQLSSLESQRIRGLCESTRPWSVSSNFPNNLPLKLKNRVQFPTIDKWTYRSNIHLRPYLNRTLAKSSRFLSSLHLSYGTVEVRYDSVRFGSVRSQIEYYYSIDRWRLNERLPRLGLYHGYSTRRRTC